MLEFLHMQHIEMTISMYRNWKRGEHTHIYIEGRVERVVPRDGNVSDIIWCQELAIIVNQLTSRFLMLSFAQLLVTFFSISPAHAPEILKQPCIIENDTQTNNALMSSCHQSKLASCCLIFNFFYHFLKSRCLLFSTVTTAIGGRCSKLSRERCMIHDCLS